MEVQHRLALVATVCRRRVQKYRYWHACGRMCRFTLVATFLCQGTFCRKACQYLYFCTGKASKVSVPSSPTGSSQHVSLQAPAGVCCMLGYSIQGTRCRAGHCIYILTYSIPALYIHTNIQHTPVRMWVYSDLPYTRHMLYVSMRIYNGALMH